MQTAQLTSQKQAHRGLHVRVTSDGNQCHVTCTHIRHRFAQAAETRAVVVLGVSICCSRRPSFFLSLLPQRIQLLLQLIPLRGEHTRDNTDIVHSKQACHPATPCLGLTQGVALSIVQHWYTTVGTTAYLRCFESFVLCQPVVAYSDFIGKLPVPVRWKVIFLAQP